LRARTVNEPLEPRGDFGAAFESAFARLQVRVEEACAAEAKWPRAVAAGIRATFEFAATAPGDAETLTNEALAQGPEGVARHRRLVAYAARLLEPGREERVDPEPLPAVLERALAGGIASLVAQRLVQGNERELPGLAPEAIEFVLTPYLGAEEARLVAGAA
jgi:hypothetical protein